MQKNTTKDLCIKGLLIALVAVATMAIQIPMPATNGYIHLGDSVILIASIFFGWKYGLLAGGIGSSLTDLLTGYAYWAPYTLIIKGLMGFIAGKTADFTPENPKFFTIRNMAAALTCEIFMVAGYFICGAIIKGSFAAAAASVPGNIIQAASGCIIYFVIGYALNKAKIYKLVKY